MSVDEILSHSIAEENLRRHDDSEAWRGEELDPDLWSSIPVEIQEHVFSRLPVSEIPRLRLLCRRWSERLGQKGFLRLCAEVNPKMFGLLGYCRRSRRYQVAAFDLKNSRRWIYRELNQGFTRESEWQYRDAVCTEDTLFSCDGGLVCFISTANRSVVVGNPLTNMWTYLPPSVFSGTQPVMVQLVTDTEAGSYVVKVVCRHVGMGLTASGRSDSSPKSGFQDQSISETAEAYHSQTGRWSMLDSGFVHGLDHTDYNLQKVFDCNSKALLTLSRGSFFDKLEILDAKLVRDRVLVLHESPSGSEPGSVFEISEFACQQDSPGSLRRISSFKSLLKNGSHDYNVDLYACDGSILLVADNPDDMVDADRQLVHLFDISHQEWHKLPSLKLSYPVKNTASLFMCELRWDASP